MAEIQFPLNQIDKDSNKTPEYWFDHFSVEIQKIGSEKVLIIYLILNY